MHVQCGPAMHSGRKRLRECDHSSHMRKRPPDKLHLRVGIVDVREWRLQRRCLLRHRIPASLQRGVRANALQRSVQQHDGWRGHCVQWWVRRHSVQRGLQQHDSERRRCMQFGMRYHSVQWGLQQHDGERRRCLRFVRWNDDVQRELQHPPNRTLERRWRELLRLQPVGHVLGSDGRGGLRVCHGRSRDLPELHQQLWDGGRRPMPGD